MNKSGVVHACPPGSAAWFPCCGKAPFEVPRTDRMTVDPSKVTCGPPAESESAAVTPKGEGT